MSRMRNGKEAIGEWIKGEEAFASRREVCLPRHTGGTVFPAAF